MKVLVLGGTGLLGSELKKISDFICTGSEIDIRDEKNLSIELDVIKPNIIVLAAAKTNSVEIDKNPIFAIETNIIGTANVTKYCIKNNIRLIYISTDYVYDSNGMEHEEHEPLNPFNYYAWSKLGGECSVIGYKKSLIIRTSFGSTEYPYTHAYSDRFVNKDYVDVIAPMIKDLVLSDETGIINVGTKSKNLFEYAQERNPHVLELKQKYPNNFTMDLTRLRKFYYKK
jgi:dTDP-4-dehydrorhamnose reductase